MAKIYVSSTFNDLQEYRVKVRDVIRRMGHEDVAMEYYVAEDQRPVSRCLNDVANCDLYIGIFAWRYGWIPEENNPEKLSITELEYREARKLKKECLIFLLDESADWKMSLVEFDKLDRIREFRKRLSERHSTGPRFSSVSDLGEKVAEAINKWEKEHGLIPSGTPTALDVERYYAALRTRYSVLPLEGLTQPERDEYLRIQLRQVFVEQNVRENPPPVELPKEVWDKLAREREIHPDDLPHGITPDDIRRAREAYYQQPPRPVLDVLTDARYPRLVILGDPGSGKSMLTRYVTLSLIDPAADARMVQAFAGYLPLLIELRMFAGLCAENKCTTFLDFLEYLGKTEGWGLTRDALHHYLKNDGRAIVLFDGLDEIFDPEQRERVTRQIVGWTNDYPKTRVIVTSRVIGYRRQILILTDAGFAYFTLQDLDRPQVETFVNRWYELAMPKRPDEAQERRARVLNAFDESASIRQLAGNPMLLTIMAIIGKHQELPRERWKLYDHAASVLVHRWDVSKHLKDTRIQADFIGEEDKKELLRRLAFRMQGAESAESTTSFVGNYIHGEQLQAVFEGYLRERYAQPPDRAKVIAEAMIQQFRERNFILVRYDANLYGFVHRAFLEYFCAAAFVRKFEKTKELTVDQLKTEVYGRHWHDQNWHEVLRLICGMVDERWAGEIITFLTRANPHWQKEETIPLHIALALHCLGEVRNPGAIPNAVGDVLKALFALFEFEFAMSPLVSGFDEHRKFMLEQIDAGIAALRQLPTEGKLETVLERFRSGNRALEYADSFAKLVAKAAGGRARVHKILLQYLNRNANYRVLVPYALALGWHDDAQTLPLVRDRAVHDDDRWVRQAAVAALIEHYRDDAQTLPLLRDRAVHDDDGWVRRVAVKALIKHFRDDAQTLPFLRDRAVHDDDGWVRRVAVKALIKHFRDDAQTLLFLRDRAVHDDNEWVRQAAVAALAEHFRDDAQTLPLLREWTVSAPHSDVRRAAVAALAEHFRDDAQTLPLVRDRAVHDDDWRVQRAAVWALAKHFRDDAQTLPLVRDRAVHDDDSDVRQAAVWALAEHFRDDAQTLPLLREWTVSAPHSDVRQAAVAALAEHFRDDAQTLPLVRDRAVHDDDSDVRSAAVAALAEHFRDDAQTLPLVRDRAVHDDDSGVRRAAVKALIEHFRDDAQTLPLLRDRAVNDDYSYVRQAAVKALIEHFRDDAQTLPLLRDRAVHDDDSDVRSAAVAALAEHFRDDAQTLPLLRDRAVNDDYSYVRQAAVAALAEHFRDDAQTLLLLRDRAVHDESPKPDEPRFPVEWYVREIAIVAIAKHWRNHPDTLPLLRERAQNDPTPWLRERARELAEEIERMSQ